MKSFKDNKKKTKKLSPLKEISTRTLKDGFVEFWWLF